MRFDDNQSIDASAMTTSDILVGTDVSTGTDKKFTLANLASWILTKFSIPTAANLAAAAGTLLGLVRANNLTGGANRNGWTALTSGQDLNSLTTPGVYYATSVIMASVVNAPYTGQCKVIVESTYANANNVQQTVMPGNTTTVTYTRRGTGVNGSSAAWSDWEIQTTGSEGTLEAGETKNITLAIGSYLLITCHNVNNANGIWLINSTSGTAGSYRVVAIKANSNITVTEASRRLTLVNGLSATANYALLRLTDTM